MGALCLMSNKASESAVKALLIAGLAAGAITVACSGKATQNPRADAPPAMPVKVIEAKALPISDATEYVATLKSRDSAVIMPQVEGYITKIFVHSGDRVSAAASLMEIDPLSNRLPSKSQGKARERLSRQR